MTTTPPATARRRWTVLAWTVFTLACAGFVAGMHSIERQRQQQADDYKRNTQYKAEIRSKMSFGRSLTPQSLADEYNHGQPLRSWNTGISHYSDVELPCELLDPRYAEWKVVLTFCTQDLSNPSASSTDTSGDTDLFPVGNHRGSFRYARLISDKTYSPDAPELWYKAQTYRRGVLGVAAIAWVAAASLLFVAGPWRRTIAQICLGIAIVGVIAIVMDPYFSPETVEGCRILPLAMVITLASVLFLFLNPGLLGNDLRYCQTCGYDLSGNLSGVCPECGTATAVHLRRLRLAGFEAFAIAIEATDLNDAADDILVPILTADAA